MRNISILSILLFFLVLSCKKDKDKVTYPAVDFYGENILAMDEDTLDVFASYSFSASLEEDATLDVSLVQTSTNDIFANSWVYDGSTNDGWVISDMDFIGRAQHFTAKNIGDISLEIIFDGTGSCDLIITENGTTSTKKLYWE